MNLKGKKIAITGGTGCIGGLLVEFVAQKGATPVIISRSPAPNSKWQYIHGDLSNIDDVTAIGKQLAKIQPDILVNLAGIQYFGSLDEQPSSQIEMLYQINLIAPVLLTQAVLPSMKKRGSGQIVNIGSIFGSIPFAHFVTYSSAKAGLKAFSEALRRELTDTGINVTYIAPRAVKTPINNEKVMQLAKQTKMAMDDPERIVARIAKAIENDAKDVYIGFPESIFVRVNALLPRVVDGALAKNDRIAAKILTPQS
jgi:short-subunit dehydrogenase